RWCARRSRGTARASRSRLRRGTSRRGSRRRTRAAGGLPRRRARGRSAVAGRRRGGRAGAPWAGRGSAPRRGGPRGRAWSCWQPTGRRRRGGAAGERLVLVRVGGDVERLLDDVRLVRVAVRVGARCTGDVLVGLVRGVDLGLLGRDEARVVPGVGTWE